MFSPSVIVSRTKGPVSVARLDRPDAFIGRWSYAQATVYGPHPTRDGFSIEFANLKLEHVSHGVTEPVVSAEHVVFLARLNSTATQKPAYDLTAEIAGGIFPSGPPIASRPFAARMTAISRIRLASSVLPTLAKVWRMSDAVSDTTSIAVLSAE